MAHLLLKGAEPGRGNTGHCAVMLYVGEGPRGSNGTCSTLHQTSIFHTTTHNHTGPLWCWFPSGWVCARPRPLWVSPMTSPVRLGLSPAAAPTPRGIFNQRSEALFPRAGELEPWVTQSASLSSGFQSFTPIPTIKLGRSGAGSRVGGLVHALGPYGSLQRPLL